MLFATGCQRSQGGGSAMPAQRMPSEGAIAQVPLGEFAGAATSRAGAYIANPYSGQPQAVQEGKDLFIKLNCAGCHAYGATGSMGPDLTDKSWRYGGAPANIYKSIYEGRPKGMPAWSRALPPSEIWKLVAYIQSLGGVVPPDQYQAALQGDTPNQTVAPEANIFETAPTRPPPAPSDAAPAVPGALSATPPAPATEGSPSPAPFKP
jgi:cytochrome c oxidase cbb3-type subunit 3